MKIAAAGELSVKTRSETMVAIFKLVTLFAVSSVVQAQDYADYGNDYAQDSIYYDYANKQVEKQAGKGGG